MIWIGLDMRWHHLAFAKVLLRSFNLAVNRGLILSSDVANISVRKLKLLVLAHDAKQRAVVCKDHVTAGLYASNVSVQAVATSRIGVPLKMDSGIFVVPVQINGTMTLDFAIDSGAADVSVPADVVSTLRRAGTIQEIDFFGQRTYVLADGSKLQSATFRIKSLKIGGMVIENVTGSLASSQGSPAPWAIVS